MNEMTRPKLRVLRTAPKRGEPVEPKLTELYRARDQAEALVIKALLEAHEIACALRTQIVQSVHPFTVSDLGAVQILVAPRDRDRAAQLLAAHRESS